MTPITLQNLANGQQITSAVSAINANNAAIITALENTLDRQGSAPNTMQATLDMNNQQIINLPAPATINSPIRVQDLTSGGTVIFQSNVPGVTPEQFGAVGNGVADDTAAVQAALNAASVVSFGVSKTYLCSNLIATRDIRLQGSGPSSIIKFKTGSTGYLFDSTTSFAVQMDSLSFDGGSTNNYALVSSPGTRSGIHLWTNLHNVGINNCYVHGFDNIGIGLNGDQSAIFTNAITHNFIYRNWCGLDNGPTGVNHTISPGGGVDGAEYLSICNNGILECRNGFVLSAGNTEFDSNILIKSGTNIYISGTGSNNSHSTITGNLCNHGQQFNLFTTAFTGIGITISGNQFFFGAWTIASGDGYTITNNTLAIETMTLSGTGWYSFTNNWFFLNTALTNTNTNTVFTGNWCLATQFWYNSTAPLLVDTRGTTVAYVPTTIGSELVTNGTFASGASWTLGSGWTISGGKANCSGTPSFSLMSQTLAGSPVTQNTFYLLTFDLSNYVSGSVNVGVGGALAPFQYFANQTNIQVILNSSVSIDQNLYFVNNSFVGSIDNVSLKKFVSDGTLFTSHITGNNLSMSVPNTQTGSSYTVIFSDSTIIANIAGTQTLTLPSAASSTGRIINVKTIQNQTVVSATSNVVPLVGGAAGTDILAATAGKWATLQSDGSNWIIIAGN